MRDQTLTLTPADAAALDRVARVRPVWRGMALARDAMAFPDHTILHAGPPVRLEEIARPLLNSAMMAALYEGWAATPSEAEAAILAGEIRLAPAQDHRAMVPLAAVLSPTMAAHIVVDGENPQNAVLAPINGGMANAQRLGLAGERVLSHLRWINGNLAATLTIIADRDFDLIEIADEALTQGDDCHGKTMAASRLLVARLAPRLGSDTPERHFLDKAPGFFLNLWMAAVKVMARAGEGDGSSLVTAMGGNGVDTGIKLGGSTGWTTLPADPPQGPLDADLPDTRRLGAIGDSALVDAMGFGAMVAANAPIMPATHPAFTRFNVRVGLPARLVAETGEAPRIALGILDREGTKGRLGGGLYHPSPTLFADALQRLG